MVHYEKKSNAVKNNILHKNRVKSRFIKRNANTFGMGKVLLLGSDKI